MRLIDASELMEHVYREKLDSRELIAKMIENAPTIAEYDKIQKENDELRRHVDYLNGKIRSLDAEVKAFSFVIRCNSISGAEVTYE